MNPSVDNILAVYNSATADELRAGMTWYNEAHNWCVKQANGREHLIRRNAGIVAALSPLTGWARNKRAAMSLISARGRVKVVKGKPNGIGLGNNVLKAIAIYNGAHPLDVLGGDKVRSFYSTILDPRGDFDPVIDRHAFDIAVGEVTDDKARSALSRKGVYAEFASAYREAADIVGIGAAQMQAITWVSWRNRHHTWDRG